MVFDKYNLVVGRKEDPGDSCHRTCMYWLYMYLKDHGEIAKAHKIMAERGIKSLKVGKGFVRHPSPGWWSDNDRLSRDQSTPLVILLFQLKNFSEAFSFFARLFLRMGFFWNTRRNGATRENHGQWKYGKGTKGNSRHNYRWKIPDFLTLSFLGLLIRGAKLLPLYPFLLLADIELAVGSLIHSSKKHTDPLNFLILTANARRNFPTPMSKLAERLKNKEVLNSKLRAYFNRVGLPELYLKWKE